MRRPALPPRRGWRSNSEQTAGRGFETLRPCRYYAPSLVVLVQRLRAYLAAPRGGRQPRQARHKTQDSQRVHGRHAPAAVHVPGRDRRQQPFRHELAPEVPMSGHGSVWFTASEATKRSTFSASTALGNPPLQSTSPNTTGGGVGVGVGVTVGVGVGLWRALARALQGVKVVGGQQPDLAGPGHQCRARGQHVGSGEPAAPERRRARRQREPGVAGLGRPEQAETRRSRPPAAIPARRCRWLSPDPRPAPASSARRSDQRREPPSVGDSGASAK